MASSSIEEMKPEEHQPQPPSPPQQPAKDCMHKTKVIQFLGRSAPIVLQNDNGPCPLLAICNVLSLRNNLNLSSDTAEVSQEKLLSLVAERLIDSNSNTDNKDAGYVENQQQNISDAIDLLPRLATGIDVNIKFKRISDFEFTPECAIFDLLDIPLYHGWIVDPQDPDTANAIGSKSYNALMGELVALETQSMETESKNTPEEDCVDFAAATTATLGVPSPCLTKSKSFDESPHSVSDERKARKGDIEEEEELLRALRLSEGEATTSVGDTLVPSVDKSLFSNSDKGAHEKVMPALSLDKSETNAAECNNFHLPDLSLPEEFNASKTESSDVMSFTTTTGQAACSSLLESSKAVNVGQPTCVKSEDYLSNGLVAKSSTNASVQVESQATTDAHTSLDIRIGSTVTEVSCLSAPNVGLDSSRDRIKHPDASETLTSSVEGGEPIYEGEERVLDSRTTVLEDREPVYEGEVVLAKQAGKSPLDAGAKVEITPQQGELIRTFLKNNASQLTFYGLFCLQDGLKERELCVFFRNNHFSTMFKFNGELYLLATDQGYLNQPDLVWEQLNEVNGDTLFMTGNFKEFKVESNENNNWDENNAVTSTADFLANMDSASHAGLDINSDLQLAIALQQQEFEQQPQRQNVQQPSGSSNSRMVTGPQQGPRNSARTSSASASSKPETKKEKCNIM